MTCGGICPAGYFCPESSSQPVICPVGFYCERSGFGNVTGPCRAGFYCPESGMLNGILCPVGKYCPEGSISPIPCPKGTASITLGNVDSSLCVACPAGYFCPFSNEECAVGQNVQDCLGKREPCPPGYFCPAGSFVGDNPDRKCPKGHFCEAQCPSPTPCPPGTYQDDLGQSSCKSCFSGMYCPGVEKLLADDPLKTSKNTTGVIVCPAGYFCPPVTISPRPCPQGFYNPRMASKDINSCMICPAGHFCDSIGLSQVNATCTAGYFCPNGSTVGDLPSNICPKGFECPEGSGWPLLCKPGTFSSTLGSIKCQLVKAGFYSNISGLISIGIRTNLSRYFTLDNTTSENSTTSNFNFGGIEFNRSMMVCRSNHVFTCTDDVPLNSTNNCSRFESNSILCTMSDSSYDLIGSGACCVCGGGIRNFSECPIETANFFGQCDAGFFCAGGSWQPNPSNTSVYGGPCPPGRYCIAGTNKSIACPFGTYQPSAKQDHCIPVPSGYMSKDGINISLCSRGHFCPSEHPYSPIPCPRGTYGPQLGTVEVGQCLPCPVGMYCSSSGISEPTGICRAGYMCPSGSLVSAPQNNESMCPKGYFCPAGTLIPIPCLPGTYNDHEYGQGPSVCIPCPAGHSCARFATTANEIQNCAADFFCPYSPFIRQIDEIFKNFSFTDVCQISSIVRSFGIGVGVDNISPTQFLCPSGHKCEPASQRAIRCCHSFESSDSSGLDCDVYQPFVMESQCVPCPSGTTCVQNHEGDGYSNYTLSCPIRHFCDEGSTPQLCPDGFYGDKENLSSIEQCQECPAGLWCRNGEVKGSCYSGYICSAGSSCADPGASNNCRQSSIPGQTNGFCPEGHYCPEGTKYPEPCPAGTRLSSKDPGFPGRSVCDCEHCLEGEYCKAGSIVAQPCAAGFFCPGVVVYKSTGLNASNCSSKYCGLFSSPKPCPAGYFNPKVGQMSIQSCLLCGQLMDDGEDYRGYYCPQENSSSQTLCPAGNFCLEGVSKEISCPAGFYRSNPGAYQLEQCELCDAGMFCPEGSIIPIPCQAGSYCPAGSSKGQACEGGFYCPGNVSIPLECPPGTYCEGATISPKLCPAGTFCPAKSFLPTLCPFGTRAIEGKSSNFSAVEDSCSPCPPGSFGAHISRLVCEPCFAGYVCYGNTTRGDPRSLARDRGEVCPPGFYCPQGSFQPNACPRGTFRKEAGASKFDECLACPSNSFNNKTGQPLCIPCGGSAISRNDSLECQCKGKNRVFQPFDSACRCMPNTTVYNSAGDPQPDEATTDGILDCEPLVMPRCTANQLRSQSGSCVQPCADSNCESPPCYCDSAGIDMCNNSCPDFQYPKAEKLQVDATIGAMVVCVCKCRAGSDNLKCVDPDVVSQAKSFEIITDSKGNAVLSITEGTNKTYYLLPSTQSTQGSNANFVGTSQDGFTGLLDAPLSFFEQLGLTECQFNSDKVCASTVQGTLSRRRGEVSELYDDVPRDVLLPGSTEYHARNTRRRNYMRRHSVMLRAIPIDNAQVTGVQTPVLCVKTGNGVIWTITSFNGVNHYPEYVPDSLFNTNPTFDYGAFVNLADKIKKGSNLTTFFLAFDQPGIYVFRDAGDKSKQTVVGVVDPVLDCPRPFQYNTIQPLSADILSSFPSAEKQQVIAPNYDLITNVMIAFSAIIAISCAIVYYRNRTAWDFQKNETPEYRKLASGDALKSLASNQNSSRKYQTLDDIEELTDYVNVDGFRADYLFDKLQDQAHFVTEKLTEQKRDAKEFYDRLSSETMNLRKLLDDKHPSGFSQHDRMLAERRKEDLFKEVRRRKAIGEVGLQLHSTLLESNKLESNVRIEHYSKVSQNFKSFFASLDQLISLWNAESLEALDSSFTKVKGLESQMAEDPGQLVGACLLDSAGNQIPADRLYDQAGRPNLEVVEIDELTKLMIPKSGSKMRTGAGQVLYVPTNCCILPGTCSVVPIEGYVYLDLSTNRFLCSNQLDRKCLLSGFIPYFCNPAPKDGRNFPHTNGIYSHLIPPIDKGWPLNSSRTMIDPCTGLRVPVLGVTLDHTSKEITAVGGSYQDPETRLLRPIRYGDLFEAPETKEIHIITGVKIDHDVYKVVPLGGK
eukprot:750985-Hanusia_phi.AAC.8